MKRYVPIFVMAAVLLSWAAPSRASTFYFAGDLSQGDTGTAVAYLQNWLAWSGCDIRSISSGKAVLGYFGEETREAVQECQYKFGLQTSGVFDGTLRRIANGAREPQATPFPVSPDSTTYMRITNVNDPTSTVDMMIAPNQMNVSNPDSGSVVSTGTMNVTVTPEPVATTSAPRGAVEGTSTASHVSYWVVKPKAGDLWKRGSMQSITWNYDPAIETDIASTSKVDILIVSNAATSTVATGVSVNDDWYPWQAGVIRTSGSLGDKAQYSFASDGQYLAYVCQAGTARCVRSAGPFTLYTSSGDQVPVMGWIDGPTQMQAGTTGTWVVHAFDPQLEDMEFSVDWGDGSQYALGTSSPSGSDYIRGITFTHTFDSSGWHTPRFTIQNSSGFNDSLTSPVLATYSAAQ